MGEFLAAWSRFFGYFGAAIAFCVAFGAVYLRLTPHREFDLIVREHNASAAIALSGTLLGFAIALAGAIRNTRSVRRVRGVGVASPPSPSSSPMAWRGSPIPSCPTAIEQQRDRRGDLARGGVDLGRRPLRRLHEPVTGGELRQARADRRADARRPPKPPPPPRGCARTWSVAVGAVGVLALGVAAVGGLSRNISCRPPTAAASPDTASELVLHASGLQPFHPVMAGASSPAAGSDTRVSAASARMAPATEAADVKREPSPVRPHLDRGVRRDRLSRHARRRRALLGRERALRLPPRRDRAGHREGRRGAARPRACISSTRSRAASATLARLKIPEHAFDLIAESWRRRDPSLYGRFDFRL